MVVPKSHSSSTAPRHRPKGKTPSAGHAKLTVTKHHAATVKWRLFWAFAAQLLVPSPSTARHRTPHHPNKTIPAFHGQRPRQALLLKKQQETPSLHPPSIVFPFSAKLSNESRSPNADSTVAGPTSPKSARSTRAKLQDGDSLNRPTQQLLHQWQRYVCDDRRPSA